ncbi:MAG: Ppx/GppA family phosphatase, partial [Acetobacteraceae bacterium]
FPEETATERRLREAACWMSDIGTRDHPEYRAEQSVLRALRQPGVGLGHQARAFLALVVAFRYEAERSAGYLAPIRSLLDLSTANRAEALGTALRLACTLSAGTPRLLAETMLVRAGRRLVLRLAEGRGVYAGDGVLRRLERLAEVTGYETALEALPAPGFAPITAS